MRDAEIAAGERARRRTTARIFVGRKHLFPILLACYLAVRLTADAIGAF